jgi:hypothetical protein
MPPAKNVLDRSIERMGQEIGAIYAHLWAECLDLNAAWGEFETLFTNNENFEIFNTEAPEFFVHLQGLMIQDLMLRVARMVDNSQAQANLSLEVLRNKLSALDKVALQDEFQNLKIVSDFAVKWRHKLYAHKDLSVTLGNPVVSFPDANCLQMEEAIKSINSVMDRVDQVFCGGVTIWTLNAGRASEQLIAVLKIAHESHKSSH